MMNPLCWEAPGLCHSHCQPRWETWGTVSDCKKNHEKDHFVPAWQVHLNLFYWKVCKNIHVLTGNRPLPFCFPGGNVRSGWKEFLNNMKCWSGTGLRLPCISDSLLVPLCRAHGKSATALQVRLGDFLLAKCLWIPISALIYISTALIYSEIQGKLAEDCEI